MITKTEFKDVVKKAIICTIANQPEIRSILEQDDDGAMNILVPFYKRVIKKIYEKRDEIKDINEIDEIYVIAFECLYKDDEETSNYIIYHKNMLCLSSVHSLYAILLNKFDDYNREIENDIMDLLKDVE